MYVHACVHLRVCVCVCVCMCVCVCACVNVHGKYNINICMLIYVYSCVDLFMCIYTCICHSRALFRTNAEDSLISIITIGC